MLFSKVYWSLTSSNEYRTWGYKKSCISSSNTYICIFYMRDWGNISIPASQGSMPVSCSFLLKASARLPALSADSGLPARAHLFTEMRPQEGYHVGVQILGFYLNVYHQLLCIQLPRWQPPCNHRAALESGPTEPEIILMSGRRPVVPRLGGSRLTCSVKFWYLQIVMSSSLRPNLVREMLSFNCTLFQGRRRNTELISLPLW